MAEVNGDFDLDAIVTTTTEHQRMLDDVQKRVEDIEDTLNRPDKLADLLAEAAKKSSVFRETLATTALSVLDDHDTRLKLQKVVQKLDRERLVQLAKYGGAFLIGVATVLGTIFAYVSIAPKN